MIRLGPLVLMRSGELDRRLLDQYKLGWAHGAEDGGTIAPPSQPVTPPVPLPRVCVEDGGQVVSLARARRRRGRRVGLA